MAKGNDLRFVKSRNQTPNCVHIDVNETRDEVEISPKTGVIVQDLCNRITHEGGAALIIDYGHEGKIAVP